MTLMPKGARQFSSREFNQNSGEAKKAAADGPVFITERGVVSHVLLSIEHYDRMVGRSRTILEMLAQPQAADVELELPVRRTSQLRHIELE